LNPELARARGLGENYLLFGAYPGEREAEVDEGLREVIETYDGRVLPAAEAYRVWGERFFPVAPSHPVPRVTREFASVANLSEVLDRVHNGNEHAAVQGTIAWAGSAPDLRCP
jgi:hypothetical protein